MKAHWRLMMLLVVSLLPPVGNVGRLGALQREGEGIVRLKAELVQLDLVVTNKKGRLIPGLRKEDFLLFEDGKEQEIAFFSAIGVRPQRSEIAQGDARQAEVEGPRDAQAFEGDRIIFLIFDRFHLSYNNRRRLLKAVRAFLQKDLAPRDHIVVATTSGGLAVFEDPQRHVTILGSVIESFLGAGSSHQADRLDEEAFAKAQHSMGIPVSETPVKIEEYKLKAAMLSLVALAEQVRNLPGHKIAVFFSEKLPVKIAENPVSDPDLSSNNLTHELDTVIAAARQVGLAFYTLDPRALVTTIPLGSAAEAETSFHGSMDAAGTVMATSDPTSPRPDLNEVGESRRGLRQLAAGTGGLPIFNDNDLRAGLRKVLADNQTYYLLAYYPQNSERERNLRRVTVKVRGRTDLTVRTRIGYVAAKKEIAESPSTKQQQVKEAVQSLAPVTGIKVLLQQRIEDDPQAGGLLAKLTVLIDLNSWQFRMEGKDHVGSMEVVAFAYDLSRKLVDGFSKTVHMRLSAETYSRVMSEGMKLRGELKLQRAGIYNLRVAVLNAGTGALGTATDWIEILPKTEKGSKKK